MEVRNIAFFETRQFEKSYYQKFSDFNFEFYSNRLNVQTAELCQGYEAICCFVNDDLDRPCLEKLYSFGVRFIALRCAGYNNVDLEAAQEFGVRVSRVPSYSPESIAEFALLQALCLSRKIHRSYVRTKELNFSLDGLVGQNLGNKTVGVVGTGQIGSAFIKLLKGFGCRVLAYDKKPSHELSSLDYVKYTQLDDLIASSNVISLHVPLTPETYHLINQERINQMKTGVLLLNTGRGGLVDSKSLINGLKNQKIGGAALDVYEEEESYFFEDFSDSGIDDDVLARLVSFPNVLVTSHQGFLTDLSLSEISQRTYLNLKEWFANKNLSCEVVYK